MRPASRSLQARKLGATASPTACRAAAIKASPLLVNITTRCRPTWCIRPAQPRSPDGGCSSAWSRRDARRSADTRLTSVRGAKREARFAGAAVPNFFRKPYGPGWALVGDAGYNKDPITAQGISDALHDAERCAVALDEAFSGARSFEEAMGDYQRARDEHALPMYEFTCQLATLQPPPPRCSGCSARSTAIRKPWTASCK